MIKSYILPYDLSDFDLGIDSTCLGRFYVLFCCRSVLGFSVVGLDCATSSLW